MSVTFLSVKACICPQSQYEQSDGAVIWLNIHIHTLTSGMHLTTDCALHVTVMIVNINLSNCPPSQHKQHSVGAVIWLNIHIHIHLSGMHLTTDCALHVTVVVVNVDLSNCPPPSQHKRQALCGCSPSLTLSLHEPLRPHEEGCGHPPSKHGRRHHEG